MLSIWLTTTPSPVSIDRTIRCSHHWSCSTKLSSSTQRSLTSFLLRADIQFADACHRHGNGASASFSPLPAVESATAIFTPPQHAASYYLWVIRLVRIYITCRWPARYISPRCLLSPSSTKAVRCEILPHLMGLH